MALNFFIYTGRSKTGWGYIRTSFTNMDEFFSQYGQVITSIITCGVNLLTIQTSIVQPLKFESG